jgi:hypothetical protein
MVNSPDACPITALEEHVLALTHLRPDWMRLQTVGTFAVLADADGRVKVRAHSLGILLKKISLYLDVVCYTTFPFLTCRICP